MVVTTALVITGAVALVVLIRHRMRAGRGVVVGMILGGWGIAGNGLVGGWLTSGAEALAEWMGEVTSAAVGTSVPGLALAAVASVIAVDVRDRAIMRVTPWLGLVLMSLVTVVGGAYAGAGGALGTVGGWLLWLAGLPTAIG